MLDYSFVNCQLPFWKIYLSKIYLIILDCHHDKGPQAGNIVLFLIYYRIVFRSIKHLNEKQYKRVAL